MFDVAERQIPADVFKSASKDVTAFQRAREMYTLGLVIFGTNDLVSSAAFMDRGIPDAWGTLGLLKPANAAVVEMGIRAAKARGAMTLIGGQAGADPRVLRRFRILPSTQSGSFLDADQIDQMLSSIKAGDDPLKVLRRHGIPDVRGYGSRRSEIGLDGVSVSPDPDTVQFVIEAAHQIDPELHPLFMKTEKEK